MSKQFNIGFSNPNYSFDRRKNNLVSVDVAEKSFQGREKIINELAITTAKLAETQNQLVETEAERDEAIKKAEEANIDKLTGCYSQSCFEELVNNLDTNHYLNGLAVVYFDINNLKIINDNHSHATGNELLKAAASLLIANFRDHDTVFRVGGDEFVVLCINQNNSEDFYDSLHRRVDNISTLAQETKISDLPVSFAFGVAVHDEKLDNSLLDTINRADSFMRDHKIAMKSMDN